MFTSVCDDRISLTGPSLEITRSEAKENVRIAVNLCLKVHANYPLT